MISKAHRFNGLRALDFVYKTGKVARGPLFAVKAAPNPRRQSYRAAVVISKKVHKSAVARNRMRRRLYESLQSLGIEINGPYDIVLTVFSDKLAGASPAELSGQLKNQLQKLGIIK